MVKPVFNLVRDNIHGLLALNKTCKVFEIVVRELISNTTKFLTD